MKKQEHKPLMTPAEFLLYIGDGYTKVGARGSAGVVKRRYAAYVEAYSVKTYLEAYWCHMDDASKDATRAGLQDKDEGRQMILLLNEEKK